MPIIIMLNIHVAQYYIYYANSRQAFLLKMPKQFCWKARETGVCIKHPFKWNSNEKRMRKMKIKWSLNVIKWLIKTIHAFMIPITRELKNYLKCVCSVRAQKPFMALSWKRIQINYKTDWCLQYIREKFWWNSV